MATARVHLYISGRVQGVGFRYAAYHEAIRLNLGGWVRNLPDGRVEAVFEGDEQSAREMAEWCKVGPPGARVRQMDAAWEGPTGEFESFRLLS